MKHERLSGLQRYTRFLPGILFSCFMALVGLSACGDDLLTDPKQIVFPDSNISYQSSVQPLFNLSCTYSGCHSSESRAGRLALTTYMEFIDEPGLIIAGKPESSVLVQILDNKLPHPVTFQDRITRNHIDGIKKWIEEGALNN
jgi:hypothetical protein